MKEQDKIDNLEIEEQEKNQDKSKISGLNTQAKQVEAVLNVGGNMSMTWLN